MPPPRAIDLGEIPYLAHTFTFVCSFCSPDPEPECVTTQGPENGEDFPRQLGLMKVRRGDSSARKESTDSNEPGNYPKQFLNCPAGLSIRLLKKFLTQKFEFSSHMEVSLGCLIGLT